METLLQAGQALGAAGWLTDSDVAMMVAGNAQEAAEVRWRAHRSGGGCSPR